MAVSPQNNVQIKGRRWLEVPLSVDSLLRVIWGGREHKDLSCFSFRGKVFLKTCFKIGICKRKRSLGGWDKDENSSTRKERSHGALRYINELI